MLTSDDISYIHECLGDIANDVEEPITYKKYKNTTPGNQVMGTPDTPNYDSTNISATVRELTLEEIQVSGGAYEFGDMQFMINHDLLNERPGYADRIEYGGISFKPKSIKHIHLGGTIGWSVRAGKV